ncbi:methyl-accepting chemotaxis protein [Marinobacterium sp. MBR-109]|uniref:methyl-accepting chemotaxis protein n=1 Tax=Marinobacterium sp. MBR-109 TaxID=3156462 RepID=UPI00339931AE
MRTLRLSTMLTGGFAIVAVIMLIVGLISIRAAMDMKNDIEQIGGTRISAIDLLNQVNTERLQIRVQGLSVLEHRYYSEAATKAHQQNINLRNASWEHLDEVLAVYTLIPRTDRGEELYQRLRKTLDAWRQSYRPVDDLMLQLSQATDSSTYEPLYFQYQQAFRDVIGPSEQVEQQLQDLIDRNKELTDLVVAESAAGANTAVTIIIIGVAFGFLLALGAGLFISRKVLRQLGGEPAMVKDVVNKVAKGDLTTEIILREGDKDSLLAYFAEMVTTMRSMMKQIADASVQVSAAAEELSASSTQTNTQVQLQQAEITQVATAMNEMAATVVDVARNAAAAAEAAQTANSETDNGLKVVNGVIEVIHQLASEIDKSASNMMELVQDSQEIGSVLDVIQEIAEQTNLLALNAAIEAARAGDHGRGFAVVADEVRSLASRTQDSTEDIQKRIDKVQHSSNAAARQMEEGKASGLKTVTQATQAGEALQTINASVAAINDMNAQIATAAEQQSSVADEINRNITNITQAIEETAAAASQVTTASQELARLSSMLQNNVQQFKLS